VQCGFAQPTFCLLRTVLLALGPALSLTISIFKNHILSALCLYWLFHRYYIVMRFELPIFLALASLAQSYTTFDTTCSLSNSTINFVSGPDTRDTLDILWSCLFTIIACTWTIQHLNIPEQRGDRDPGWKGDLEWQLKGTWTSLKWMVVTMVAPEILIETAWEDLFFAWDDLRKMTWFAAQDGVPWTLTHTLFANMGGFVIRCNLSSGSDRASDYHNPYHLTTSEILSLRRAGHLPRLPCITLAEINDKSKSDMFVRIIACVQISWVVLQVIARAARHLAVSQLEIAVLAFATCAIIIYALNWKKPKGAQVPFLILEYPGEIPKDVLAVLKKTAEGREGALLSGLFGRFSGKSGPVLGRPISNDRIYPSDWFFGLAIGCTLFGAIHIAAWNFAFPTRTDQILWRACSIWCTVFVFIFSLFELLLSPADSNGSDFFWDYCVALLSFLYVAAGLALLVEIFRTLCFLPPDAYIATLASNIPHLA
jgi:hypothetical protein